ncbi:Membrane associated serine protease, rhomboid family [Myroides phaeus]|uniref:Membrane associated serine protease, rhomboid family n=2 Tax=Myroides phaeus TaxID=702745 RepID=A0A1G8F8E4_9FLAO|nr:Membrane associated serine protease, rhomboid family [Myroides phaeus]
MMRITETVKHLIIVNIIFFVASFLVPAMQGLFAMYFVENPNFYIWQPLTHMFMHGGMMHIFFNMFALFSFGSTLEAMWGGKKFLTFYLLCGFGAAIVHTGVNYITIESAISTLVDSGFNKGDILSLLSEGKYDLRWGGILGEGHLMNFLSAFNTPVVGASGAIYGLLVAFAFMFPNAELMMMFIPVPVKAKYFVPGILLLDLYGGVSGGFSLFGGGSGIAHFAHIGGALMGFILMYYWKKRQFRHNRWDL